VALVRLECTVNFTNTLLFRGGITDPVRAVQLPTTTTDSWKSTAVISGFGIDQSCVTEPLILRLEFCILLQTIKTMCSVKRCIIFM
jgi:hypothetical protein